MTTTDYAMKTRTSLSPEEAEALVREHLAAEGFGVLTEIDVAETLRAKLGVERSAYKILGACRPQLADGALQAEPDAGLLLPCNVVVYAEGESTVVAILDPASMVDITGNPSLAPFAIEAKQRLARVISALADR